MTSPFTSEPAMVASLCGLRFGCPFASSYMAAVAAQPVFRLLGAKDLGVSDDYMKERMLAVNVSMLDGHLA